MVFRLDTMPKNHCSIEGTRSAMIVRIEAVAVISSDAADFLSPIDSGQAPHLWQFTFRIWHGNDLTSTFVKPIHY